jgi:hypothetical protein
LFVTKFKALIYTSKMLDKGVVAISLLMPLGEIVDHPTRLTYYMFYI